MAVPEAPTSLSLLERARAQPARSPGAEDAWTTLVEIYTPLLNVWLTAAQLQPADFD